ncbi:MAG: flagellar hook-length control protein FliK [Pseudomonadota bacterium]
MSEQPFAFLTDSALLAGAGTGEFGTAPGGSAPDASGIAAGSSEFAQVLSALEPTQAQGQALPVTPNLDPLANPAAAGTAETAEPLALAPLLHQDPATVADITNRSAPQEVRKPVPAEVALGDLHGRGTHGPRTGHLSTATPLPPSGSTELTLPEADTATELLRPTLASTLASTLAPNLAPTLAPTQPDAPAITLAAANSHPQAQPAAAANASLAGAQDLKAVAADELRSPRPPLVLARTTPQDPVAANADLQISDTAARSVNPATALTALDALRRWAPDQTAPARMSAAAAVGAPAAASGADLSPLLSPSEAISGVTTPAPATGPLATLPQLSGPAGTALAQITDQIQVMVQNDQREARLQLHPRELGVVNIRISLHADQASLVLEASNPELQRELSQHLPRLREAFGQEGLDLSQFSLEQQTQQQEERSSQQSAPRRALMGESPPLELAATAPSPRPTAGTRLLDVFA